ncbi:unnamed protein product, partial [Iphiclides podalirius]
MFAPSTKAAWWLATFLTVFVTGEMPIQAELEPEFLQELENHTVTQGRDVHFTCVVNHLSNYRVAWIKSDSKAILAIHTNMVALNPRLSVTYNNHNTWKLHVSNVQANDSGTYMCQVNTDPMKSQMGHLSVVIPPDIVDTVTEGSSAREGGSVRLTCSATGVPPPTVMWRRENNRPIVFRQEGGREKKGTCHFGGNSNGRNSAALLFKIGFDSRLGQTADGDATLTGPCRDVDVTPGGVASASRRPSPPH